MKRVSRRALPISCLTMPLEPQPPPSPMGKPTPPPKHICSPLSPCTICLSEVGKCYHMFPKGTFKARFALPAIPRHVLQHLAKSPPTWTWTTRTSPRAGKSFQVPSIPTACSRDSPRVIQWIISIFHAFKAQLAPQALGQETSQVLPDVEGAVPMSVRVCDFDPRKTCLAELGRASERG